MLQNARVTAFTVSELLMENQQGGGVKFHPPTQIRVSKVNLTVKLYLKKIWHGYFIHRRLPFETERCNICISLYDQNRV